MFATFWQEERGKEGGQKKSPNSWCPTPTLRVCAELSSCTVTLTLCLHMELLSGVLRQPRSPEGSSNVTRATTKWHTWSRGIELDYCITSYLHMKSSRGKQPQTVWCLIPPPPRRPWPPSPQRSWCDPCPGNVGNSSPRESWAKFGKRTWDKVLSFS